MRPTLVCIDEAPAFVREQIDAISERSDRPNLYQDIKAACHENRAFLFLSEDEKSFAVLRPRPNVVVQVWVGYCPNAMGFRKYLPILIDLCRDLEAREIEFETAIEGVERLMRRAGCRKKYTIWRMPL